MNPLQSIENKAVIVIGDVMIDSYIWGKVDRISPEAPVPVVSVNKTENRLGGAANVAQNLAALQLTPILCSVIGCDEAGANLKELLRQKSLCADYCIEIPERKTTNKQRILSGNHQILRIDTEQTNEISVGIRNTLFKSICHAIETHNAAAIVLEDYDKGVISKELIDQVVAYAQKKQLPVFVDPKKRNFSYYTNITLFKPNVKEFIEGSGTVVSAQDLPHLFEVSKEFMRKQSIENLMITLSEHGIFVANKQGYHHLPSMVRHVADVSGAGDTVISTTVACWLAGIDLPEIARIANVAAGIACEQPGVVTINQKQLLEQI
ncbi:MAG: bifunctional ADP-heptose synthase [Bacteroidetes bacterium]|nr:bifunctional ADP-heptose synthase [Bacteroidota bacterium]